MTEFTDADFTVARGFPMNGQGRKMVTHPETGKLVGYWGASDWPLDPPYTGPPDAGAKGTWVHDLVGYLVGARTADGLKAERERLGIPAEVAKHIAADWQRFADEHAIVVHHVEHPSVNDRYEIASPIDIVGTVGGQPAIIDIKTGKPVRTSYAVQMVYYAGSACYTEGKRSDWFGLAQGYWPAAYLAHYPLSAALKAHAAGDPLPRWELHPVDVEAARPWADMLHTLRRINPRVAFPGRADVVDDGYMFTYVDASTPLADAIRDNGIVIASNATDSTQAVGDVDTDSPQAVDKIAAPDTSHGSEPSVEQPAGEAGRDNPTSPAKSYDLDRFGRPILPPADDGDDADPAAVVALKARYAALEGDGKAWVNAVAKGAQAAGGALSLADSQPQSIRRFEAMRALVLLAEGGFADDDAVRGILRPILGDVADMAAFTIGKLVAALGADEAARFAQLADTVANGSVALSVKLDGRYEWEFAA